MSILLLRKYLIMKTIILAACAGLLFVLPSCNSGSTGNGSTSDSVKTTPLAPIAVAMVPPSPEFPGAALSIASVTAEKIGNDSAKVSFAFDVKNYELKMQTSDNGTKMCNNSDKGQHIHFILDNQPYKALYEPKNEVTLANGTEHYLMAFLSRSYHESIKSKGAAIVYHFSIDKNGKLVKMANPTRPMVFYSRPKGDYIGKDTANVLLDFYVWNDSLSSTGSKMKVQVSNESRSGRDTTFTLDKWAPVFIQNLGTGKSKVQLTLVDKNGNQIDSSFGKPAREFNLLATEPSKK
jgi:hypothetical protein